MYLTFYGLAERPFNATPDPKFLYMSPGHKEALAQLVYGTQERKGFIVLTGKVGTGKTTLLQILLVGQPELKTKLNLPELWQLRQRVGLRCQIPSLTLEETRAYIRTRLRIAGARDLSVFVDGAVDRIVAYSGGIPRLINTV